MGKLKNWYIDDNQEDDNKYDYEDEVNKEDLKFMNEYSNCDCKRCAEVEKNLATTKSAPFFNANGILENPKTGEVFLNGEWCDMMNISEWLAFNGINNIQPTI